VGGFDRSLTFGGTLAVQIALNCAILHLNAQTARVGWITVAPVLAAI
jgi:hypothetical protein